MIKGAIFDVDGTLLDTMGKWHDASRIYLGRLGISTDPDIGDRYFALTITGTARAIKEEYGLSASVSEIVDGIDGIMEEFYRTEARPKPGAEELLDRFRQAGIPMVVGTSTDRRPIEAALTRLGLDQYFLRIFTCTEVGHPKSDPELFLAAMELMGSDPEETVLFEDGLYSIRTAAALGIKTVGVYDRISRADQEAIRDLAWDYLPEGASLAELTRILDDAKSADNKNSK